MVEDNKRPPFPQANDLEKVLKIINVSNPDIILNDDSLAAQLDGIASRQARYYIAAAKYLGILDQDKNFSEIGNKLRCMNTYMQKVELIRIVLSDIVFGTVFYTEKVLGMTMTKEDIIDIIKKEYPEYCEAIYPRRAQTVQSWLNWVKSQFA